MPRRPTSKFDAIDGWAKEHMPFLEQAEDATAFFRKIAEFLPPPDPRYKAIVKAYATAQDAFSSVTRDSGEPYFGHLRAVTLILLEYLEVRDVDVIIAALLHDIVEDRAEWNIERVQLEFGERVALFVAFLTQPKNDEFGDKQRSEGVYHARFELAPREFFLIKLADRLHNLLTLKHRPRAKQQAKIEETVRFYMPYARREMILLPELRKVLYLLEAATA